MNKLYNFSIKTAISNLSLNDIIEDWEEIIKDFATINITLPTMDKCNYLPMLKTAAMIGAGYTDEDDISAVGILSFLAWIGHYEKFNFPKIQNYNNLSYLTYTIPSILVSLAWSACNHDDSLHDTTNNLLDEIKNITKNDTKNNLSLIQNIFDKNNPLFKKYKDKILNLSEFKDILEMVQYINEYKPKLMFGQQSCEKEIQSSLSIKQCCVCSTTNHKNIYILSNGEISKNNISIENFDINKYQKSTETNLSFLTRTYTTLKFNLITEDRTESSKNKSFDDLYKETKIDCYQNINTTTNIEYTIKDSTEFNDVLVTDSIEKKYASGLKNKTRTTDDITEIVIHGTAGGAPTREALGEWLFQGKEFGYRYKSDAIGLFHYGIDIYGKSIQLLDPAKFWAFHSTSASHDKHTIGIELINQNANNDSPYTEKQYAALLELTTNLMKKFPKCRLIVSHNRNIKYYSPNEFPKNCPGNFDWNLYIKLLKDKGWDVELLKPHVLKINNNLE